MTDPATTAKLESWAERNAKVNRYGSREYSPFVCHIMNLFDERSRDKGCECKWLSPYGFVPEAGCTQHDT